MPKMKPRSRAVAAQIARQQESDIAEHNLQVWADSIPTRYRGFTTEDIMSGWSGSLDRPGVTAIKRYLEAPEEGFLLLTGSAGTGKTTLAITTATELIRRRSEPAIFINSIALLQAFSWEGGSGALENYSTVPILVVDDLGSVVEGISPHQRKMLWVLIENRWSNKLPTILTTNMAIQDVSGSNGGIGLASWVGPSGWDRIIDGLTRIALEGDSLRGDDD